MSNLGLTLEKPSEPSEQALKMLVLESYSWGSGGADLGAGAS